MSLFLSGFYMKELFQILLLGEKYDHPLQVFKINKFHTKNVIQGEGFGMENEDAS